MEIKPGRMASNTSLKMAVKTNMSRFRNGMLALALLGLTACDEPKITTYRVAKERRAEPMEPQHAGHAHDAPARRPRPKLTWTAPAGWRELAPDDVNLAAFNILTESGKDARVSVAALPFLEGREGDIVNIWRTGLGLNPLEPDQAREQLRDLDVNGEKGKLFEISSGDATNLQKIVTVMVHRPGASWFYKIQGDAPAVESHRDTFIDFVKSVRIQDSPASASAPSPTSIPSAGSFAKAAPADWQVLRAGEMQVAKFSIPAVQGATGQVSVSIFDNETGGALENVNRWRRQIGLGNISAEQLRQTTVPLDPAAPGAILVNMTNNSQQLIGAIVPRGSQWFFYKLVGNPPAVTAQKEAFVRFAAATPQHE
jgi:hypothetical protein